MLNKILVFLNDLLFILEADKSEPWYESFHTNVKLKLIVIVTPGATKTIGKLELSVNIFNQTIVA